MSEEVKWDEGTIGLLTASSSAVRPLYYRPEIARWPGPLQRVVRQHRTGSLLSKGDSLIRPRGLLVEFAGTALLGPALFNEISHLSCTVH